nr:hypothetical protein [Deltaproteobacteria bacterium]
MVTYGRGVRSTMAVILALVVGCGSARGGGVTLDTPDVPGTPDDRGAVAMDSGTPPVDSGTPPADSGSPPLDVGTPVDRGVAPMDVVGCVPSGAENTAAACADGLDNDCDGFRDCTEPSCDSFCGVPPVDSGVGVDSGCVRSGDEGTNAACSDGVDNDCDGYFDCNDFSCSMSPSVTLCPRDAGPPDTGCVRTGTEDNPTACADRIDNDCDGYVDCTDFNCQRSSVPFCPYDAGVRPDTAGCVASPENTNATCADGIDNDCDGFRDCNDRSCTNTCVVTVCVSTRDAGSCVCRGAESSVGACSNGLDDDCDGFVDCMDFDCSMNNPAVTFCRDGG